MAFILANGKQQYFDNSGNPLVGGRLFTMQPGPGVTTPKNTWTDAGETALNANPIILDARGEAQVFWRGSYNVRLETAAGGLIYTVESIVGSDFALREELADTTDVTHGDALVGVQLVGVGTVARTQHGKNAESVSIGDFGAVGDNVTDDTAEITAALASGFKYVTAAPTSTAYLLSAEVVIPAGVTFDGQGATFRQSTAGEGGFRLAGAGAKIINCKIEGSPSNAGGSFETGANGVYALAADRFEVRNCEIYGFEYNGVLIQNCNDWVVDNNLFYSNRWVSPSSADILTYSTVASRGGFITKNRCYSNNSQGIYVSAIGNDSDCTIMSNRCIAMNGSFVPVVSPNVLRRHGIQLGYAGVTFRRHICVGNVIQTTSWTGIYYQGPDDSSVGSVLIAYNYILNTGIDSVLVALSSGITLAAQGEGDIVCGNVIENTFAGGILGESAGISLQPNPGTLEVSNNRNTLITGNTIINSSGSGIQVVLQAINATVSENNITNSTLTSIYVQINPVPGGGLQATRVLSNVIRHQNDTSPAIRIGMALNTGGVTLRGNQLSGLNNTTNTIANTGIYIGSIDTGANRIEIEGNVVRNFRNGIAPDYYLTAQQTLTVARNNSFVDVFNGIAAASVATNGRLIGTGNTYSGVTNRTTNGPLGGTSIAWEGATLDGTTSVYVSAAPTTGTWSVGDRAIRNPPAAGQPKAWSCTVAGNPGTWVSEGNL